MADKVIHYFAYGSNMLPQRLIDRCPSAKALGAASATGHYLSFGKRGNDGSGKAAIVKTKDENDQVFGVLFELAENELDDLDKFEHKYKRNNDFKVNYNGKNLNAISYYLPKSDIEIGLLPTDWYRDICVAGAKMHGLDAAYVSTLENLLVREDPKNEAHKYLKSLTIESL